MAIAATGQLVMIANERYLAAARQEMQQLKPTGKEMILRLWLMRGWQIVAEQIMMSNDPQHLAAARQGETTACSLAHCQCCNRGRHVQFLRGEGHLLCGGG